MIGRTIKTYRTGSGPFPQRWAVREDLRSPNPDRNRTVVMGELHWDPDALKNPGLMRWGTRTVRVKVADPFYHTKHGTFTPEESLKIRVA